MCASTVRTLLPALGADDVESCWNCCKPGAPALNHLASSLIPPSLAAANRMRAQFPLAPDGRGTRGSGRLWVPSRQVGRRPDGMVHLADSLKMAVALRRGFEGGPSLYRVDPIGQPQATDNPGDFVCYDATVIAEVQSPKWGNDELWPLVSATKWPDGSPMYNEDASITDPPGFPAAWCPQG